MTFAEIIILVAFGIGIYFLLKPLRLFLEATLYRFFKSRSQQKGDSTIIDITNYKKTEKNKKDNPDGTV